MRTLGDFEFCMFLLFRLQVLCNTGRLKTIPTHFPLETQEITITNQDVKSIPANSKLTDEDDE